MTTVDYVVLGLWVLVIASAYGVYWWRFKRQRAYHTVLLIGEWQDITDVSFALQVYEDVWWGLRDITYISRGYYSSTQQFAHYRVEGYSLKGFMQKVNTLQQRYTFEVVDPALHPKLVNTTDH